MSKGMVVFLITSLFCFSAQAATIQLNEDGTRATGISGLLVQHEVAPNTFVDAFYDVVFDYVVGNHGDKSKDIFMNTENALASQEAALAINDLINTYNSLSVNPVKITQVGSAVGTSSFYIPFLYDPSIVCDDLCAQKGRRLGSLFNYAESTLLPDEAANFARLTELSAVPVPPAVYLFGSGVLGLIGIARRRRAAGAV